MAVLRAMVVGKFVQQGGKGAGFGGGEAGMNCKLFVGNLAYSVNWKKLKDHFTKAGNVTYANIIRDGGSPTTPAGFTIQEGLSKGMGIVEFSNAADARKAMNLLQGTDLGGRPIAIEPYQRNQNSIGAGKGGPSPNSTGYQAAGKGSPQGFGGAGKGWSGGSGKGGYTPSVPKGNAANKVFVSHLAFKTNWEGLKAHFSSAGTVAFAKVICDQSKGKGASGDGWSTGDGIVEFSNAMQAQQAVSMLNGSVLDGRPIMVDAWGSK